MKKYFYLAAVSAMMLTACSSEKDVLEPTTGPAKQEVTQQAVGFDVYVPAATAGTRAGLEGTMTTGRMQRSLYDGGGFGVYSSLTEDVNTAAGTSYSEPNATSYKAGDAPNFMVNEMILWNSTNQGWYYNPLKYWPNETDHDSQSSNAQMEGTNTHLDRLTFFAYAPYVEKGSGSYGITLISDKAGELGGGAVNNPSIQYTVATTDNLDQGVDLLWGVAPSGGLTYTAVNGWTVTKEEGTPLINMIKPNVNTSMKFLFEHALARIGVTVVSAIDQVSPGGELDPNTKITIKSLKLSGLFGTIGVLDLNNGDKKHVANWIQLNSVPVTSSTVASSLGAKKDLKVNNGGAAKGINQHLQYSGTKETQDVVGVTTTKQDLLTPSTKWFTQLGSKPAYNPGKKYYSDEGTTQLTASYKTTDTDKLYTLASGVYTVAGADKTISAPAYPKVNVTGYYILSEITSIPSGTTSCPDATKKYYTKDANGIYSNTTTWPSTETYYVVEARQAQATDIPFVYANASKYYEAERNYFMIIPTNNILAQNSSISTNDANDLALRTITVEIEYYITTTDSKLNDGVAQTKNVITKDVVFPSLANGKSYNLNLVLGLTSVKMEAEVDDWKVINVQADLPQNTGE